MEKARHRECERENGTNHQMEANKQGDSEAEVQWEIEGGQACAMHEGVSVELSRTSACHVRRIVGCLFGFRGGVVRGKARQKHDWPEASKTWFVKVKTDNLVSSPAY